MKRYLEIDEDEYYIIKRAVDFLTSAYASIGPAGINSKDLYNLDSKLSYTKFKDLPKTLEDK